MAVAATSAGVSYCHGSSQPTDCSGAICTGEVGGVNGAAGL